MNASGSTRDRSLASQYTLEKKIYDNKLNLIMPVRTKKKMNKKTIIIIVVSVVCVVAIALGLGLGLGLKKPCSLAEMTSYQACITDCTIQHPLDPTSCVSTCAAELNCNPNADE